MGEGVEHVSPDGSQESLGSNLPKLANFNNIPTTFTSTNLASFEQLLQEVEVIEKIIDKLIDSKIVKDNFSRSVTQGNKEVLEVDRGDVMICLQMAQHLGIPPLTALSMGKVFNKVGYLKAVTGVALGFDPMISQTKFFGFEDKDKNLQAGMYVATMQILCAKEGIRLEYIEEDVPVKWYKSSSNDFMGTTLLPNMLVVPDGKLVASWTDAQKEAFQLKLLDPNTLGCTIAGTTRRTTVRAYRKHKDGSTQEVTRSYCLQEAIDAGLAKGKTTTGETVLGKSNWVNVADMLSARAIGRVLKVIGADALKGVSLVDELKDSENLTAIG